MGNRELKVDRVERDEREKEERGVLSLSNRRCQSQAVIEINASKEEQQEVGQKEGGRWDGERRGYFSARSSEHWLKIARLGRWRGRFIGGSHQTCRSRKGGRQEALDAAAKKREEEENKKAAAK